MTEEFNNLYNELYRQNISELEKYRAGIKKNIVVTALGILIFAILMTTGFAYITMAIVAIVAVIMLISYFKEKYTNLKGDKVLSSEQEEKRKYSSSANYEMFFKKEIVNPLIQSIDPKAIYNPNEGIDENVYSEAQFEDNYSIYKSEDQISLFLDDEDTNKTTDLTLSEIHTEKQYTDKDGHTHYTTIFHGIMGYLGVYKQSSSHIKIKQNGRIGSWNKFKVNMDMSEFEKYFDVESDNKIEAMQILTSDIMADLIDFVAKNKTKLEIHLINDKLYIRFNTGAMFEPKLFGHIMEKELIWRYYNVSRFCINLIIKMRKVINDAQI